MFEWINDRAKEPSTWKGISLLLSVFGVGVAPELITQIGMATVTVIGIIETLKKEK